MRISSILLLSLVVTVCLCKGAAIEEDIDSHKTVEKVEPFPANGQLSVLNQRKKRGVVEPKSSVEPFPANGQLSVLYPRKKRGVFEPKSSVDPIQNNHQLS
ncbi:unnamed protein product [Nezara viridula]|uniref:Neuropeptide n=1 Tax=Nezara viridula TaxID=85310 RepID=A0A9P0HJX3_NEZVI|nr:unnamed protein product [Nezara viridula]